MSERYKAAGPEPPLEELLVDPIMKLLLERNDIDPAACGRRHCACPAR